MKVTQKQILEKLGEIFEGRLTQYFFLPRKTYAARKKERLDIEDLCEGLIVNFQDIGFFDAATVALIERQNMDFEKLSEADLERYGKMFFLEKAGDMIFSEETISSPYRERLMQAFSSAFIRIGVDFDSKAAKDYWGRVLQDSTP